MRYSTQELFWIVSIICRTRYISTNCFLRADSPFFTYIMYIIYVTLLGYFNRNILRLRAVNLQRKWGHRAKVMKNVQLTCADLQHLVTLCRRYLQFYHSYRDCWPICIHALRRLTITKKQCWMTKRGHKCLYRNACTSVHSAEFF